jgi:acyl CoA:acetate/3-ketoacid CoA transferase
MVTVTRNGRTVLNTKEIFKKAINKGMGFSQLLTIVLIRENLKQTKSMDTGISFGVIKKNMKVFGATTKCRARVILFGQMGGDMKDSM